MSGDYPLGADCDTDAMRELRTMQAWPNPLLASPNPFDVAELRFRTHRWGFTYLDSSPQCRGDGATGPGGGAPTSQETQ